MMRLFNSNTNFKNDRSFLLTQFAINNYELVTGILTGEIVGLFGTTNVFLLLPLSLKLQYKQANSLLSDFRNLQTRINKYFMKLQTFSKNNKQ